MSSKRDAEYYHARATEMMEKAQAAPTKATRLAYLNLATKWAKEANRLERAASSEGASPPVRKK